LLRQICSVWIPGWLLQLNLSIWNAMTSKMLAGQAAQPWYKERWPWILMAGPGVVIVAGVVTAWLAIKTSDGLVDDDYYKQGLTVNQTKHRDQKAASEGLQADVVRSGTLIRVYLSGKEGVNLPQKLMLRIKHPTRSGLDQSVELLAEGAGFYAGKLTTEIAGRWHLTIEDTTGQWRLLGDWQADSLEPLRLTSGQAASSTINRSVTGR
jgi:hypothetical protein